MIAANLDNLLFLLLVVVAGLFQFLAKVLAKKGKDQAKPPSPPQTPASSERAPSDSGEDTIRKLLEALGQPASSTPPPPVRPRIDMPPRPLAPVRPPPVILPRALRLPRERRHKPDVTQRESPLREQPSRFQEVVPLPVPAPAPPAFEVHEALPVEVQPPIVETPVEAYATGKAFGVAKGKANIATLLVSKSDLREAILLREILGPPRGLQEIAATL